MNFHPSGTPMTFLYVRNRERALRFYSEILGLELHSTDTFGDFLALGDVLLRMTLVPGFDAHAHPVLGWNVADIESAAAALRERGVTFTVFEGMGQDENGIWTAPGGTSRLGWFLDSEGNVLMLSQL